MSFAVMAVAVMVDPVHKHKVKKSDIDQLNLMLIRLLNSATTLVRIEMNGRLAAKRVMIVIKVKGHHVEFRLV